MKIEREEIIRQGLFPAARALCLTLALTLKAFKSTHSSKTSKQAEAEAR